jgi:hypothetical protein
LFFFQNNTHIINVSLVHVCCPHLRRSLPRIIKTPPGI